MKELQKKPPLMGYDHVSNFFFQRLLLLFFIFLMKVIIFEILLRLYQNRVKICISIVREVKKIYRMKYARQKK